jgi:hypothetical protein
MSLPLTITASGASAGFRLPWGEPWLFISSTGWGSATLQVSRDNSPGSYRNARDASGNAVTFTSDWASPVAGGVWYRLNVTAYSQPITVVVEAAT